MYGPKDDNTKFVTWITNQMLQNVESVDLTEGIQKRDFIYIDDVVDVYLLMLEKSKIFQAFSEFDVGTGDQIELKEFILKIYKEISKIKPISTKLNFGAKAYREGEFMEIEEDVKPLFDLGWKPKISIEDGIKLIIKEAIQ
jgi:nucleoside-diphosphate-sugar epimerase